MLIFYWDPIEILSRSYQDSICTPLRLLHSNANTITFDGDSIKIILILCRDSVEIMLGSYQDSICIPWRFSILLQT